MIGEFLVLVGCIGDAIVLWTTRKTEKKVIWRFSFACSLLVIAGLVFEWRSEIIEKRGRTLTKAQQDRITEVVKYHITLIRGTTCFEIGYSDELPELTNLLNQIVEAVVKSQPVQVKTGWMNGYGKSGIRISGSSNCWSLTYSLKTLFEEDGFKASIDEYASLREDTNYSNFLEIRVCPP